MPDVLIRALPPEVHARLTERAREAGQSLQTYLLRELTELADRPTMAEVVAALEACEPSGRIGFEQAVEDLSADRAR